MTIPAFHVPTVEEFHSTAERWMEPLRPCLYTHWPQRFKDLSFKTWVEELTPVETAELASIFNEQTDQPWSDGLIAKIARGTAQHTNGCFFKIESRSPKDNYWGEKTGFRACSWHDVKRLIYSERMLDDLARYSNLESEPLRLLFREWQPIEKSGEFRCFIKNLTLAGISQYHYVGFDEGSATNKPLALAKVYGRAKQTEATLKAFIAAEIIPHLHVEDLVADLWLDHMGKLTLIEINPYGLSDPCLFSYEELETTLGEFRFNRPHKEAA